MRLRPVIAGVLVAACARPSDPGVDAAFVLAAGDSTFLVEATARGFEVFRAPLLLARLDGRFEEVYLVDQDLSFPRALFVGQSVYRRDLLSGDSTLVWADERIAAIAARWQQRHPGDVPLGPDEEITDDSTTQATSDTELLDVVGPFLNLEFHLDVDASPEPHEHVSRRLVVDLRTGGVVTLRQLTDSASAARAEALGRDAFAAALDSVRRSTGPRAARAREVVNAFGFDPTSFEVVDVDRRAIVTFFAPSQGAAAGGYVLPVGDAPIVSSGWEAEWADTRPTASGPARLAWEDSLVRVVASARGDGDRAAVEIEVGGRRQAVADLPTPVRRLYRLGATIEDRRWRDALRRAFAQWSGDAFVAPTRSTTPRPPSSPSRRS